MQHENWTAVDARFTEILDELDMARPLDVERLCRSVSDRRGRPLHLLPLPETAGSVAGVCGLWLSLGDADIVFYEAATSRVHQTHIILHELAHMLLDHRGQQEMDRSLPAGLFPDLDPVMVNRMLARGRTDYSAVEEQQAELLATLMSSHGRSRPVAGRDASSRAAGVLGRLGDALGLGRGA
ncbi:hypothetical protein [Streptomyces sp. NBC_01408]|uniref:hypothetical protein n=1 Tax=Streptomyces sp. NBC_01408 TaxID=2903855 RepID=UPI002252ADA6|nr:hypothetical protein [Streptomyces sp. NBC_01408]MCX4694356.1 hypothetical protein [Streptomyces sp. NBC_01408]